MEYPSTIRKARQFLLNHSIIYHLYKAVTGAIKAYRTKIYYHTPREIPKSEWIEATVPPATFVTMERELKPFLDAYQDRVRRFDRPHSGLGVQGGNRYPEPGRAGGFKAGVSSGAARAAPTSATTCSNPYSTPGR